MHPEAVHQELVPERPRLLLVAVGKADRDIAAERSAAHRLGEKAALKCPVFVHASRGDELGTEHVERPRVEFPVAVHLCAKDRQSLHVAVVEDLDDLGLLVAEAEVALIEDQRAAEGIERVEDRRDGRGAAREDRLVHERADREEEAGLAAPKVAAKPKVRQFVEPIVNPGEKDIEGGKTLKARRDVDIPVDVLLDSGVEGFARVELCGFGRQEHHPIGDEVVGRRVGSKRCRAGFDFCLTGPPGAVPDREGCSLSLRVEQELDHPAVIEDGRDRRSAHLLRLWWWCIHGGEIGARAGPMRIRVESGAS